MKPSDRIMEIYQEEIKAHLPIKPGGEEAFGIISNRVYCDSVVAFLNERYYNMMGDGK